MNTTELRERWLRLRPRVDGVAKQAGALRRVVRKLATEEGYEALRKLQKEIATLETLELDTDGILDNVREALGPVESWLEAEWTRRAEQFAEELHSFFADREVELTGVPPLLEAGQLGIEFDTRQDQARILYAREVVRDRIPLAPERIFREWQNASQRLERGLTSPDEFFTAVVDAYDLVCRTRGLKPGSRVRLPDLHFQLFVARQTAQVRQDPRKGRLKEYPRYQFAYDLSALLNSPGGMVRGNKAVSLHIAARSAAESRSASVLLDDGRGGWAYYGDVQVESAGARR